MTGLSVQQLQLPNESGESEHETALDSLKEHHHYRVWAALCSDDNPDKEQRDAYRSLVIRRAKGEPVRRPPPITRQLANAAGAIVRLGIQFLTGGPLLVSPAELDRRLSICQPCPNWTGSRCTACGCFGQLKARLESETGECPDGKW